MSLSATSTLVPLAFLVLFHASVSFGWLREFVAIIATVSATVFARRALAREVCPICCESVLQLRMHPRRPRAMDMRRAEVHECAEHRCCADCWQRYLAVNESSFTDRLRRRRSTLALTCYGCDKPLARSIVHKFAPPALLSVCALIERREELVQRGASLNYRVVDCPQCAYGLGYDDGQETSMCFLCEHQWDLRRSRFGLPSWSAVGSWLSALWPTRGLAGSRPCPHCGVAIQKDGGCPMMRCTLCDKPFRWGAFANSTEQVIIEHCAPARRRPARR